MSKKISLGVAAAIALIAMAVTFSLTMVISMNMFNSTVSSVKEKERQYNKLLEMRKKAAQYGIQVQAVGDRPLCACQ